MSKELSEWRDKYLNTISKSFCAAKWYNASLHLGHGYTNSCHLPLPHPIDLEKIKDNPSALHNTDHKKVARLMMLEGVRPAECSYCWKVEDMGKDSIADRVYKSRIYTPEELEKIKSIPHDSDVLLKTVEISFDRTCNFACSYCNSGYSTTWGKDITDNGPYQKFKTSSAGAYHADGSWAEPFGKNSKENPYVDAFLRWWPELSKELQEVRITGGEPATSHNFWNFLKEVKKHPAPNMTLAVNSNLGVSDKLIDRLIAESHEINVKGFELYTSNESYGKHAEYIRDGIVYDKWRENLVRIIEEAKVEQVIVMMTINSLCLFSITEFMDDMIELKRKYGWNKPLIDLNILRWPAFMSPLNLPDDIKSKLHLKLKNWFDIHKNNDVIAVHEKAQIQRLIDYIEVVDQGHVNTENEKELHFHDFKSFYEQYDKRRGKNFTETFPELKEWYDSLEVDYTIDDVEITSGHITHFEIEEYAPDIERRKKKDNTIDTKKWKSIKLPK
jgi:organic radical activating enzyme